MALRFAKENNRLFMIADMIQHGKAEEINKDLTQSEETKLKELGKTRAITKI